ncbi:uncharacterized protein LOC111081881 isoform X1 [Drosophila obscura]|uniref:uncharacterized protein LOC111081881 isoform X1 n=1 Tax=Drosophila obscura TaxID=7282 RepID=UPI001BB155E2|nr:uncharacterized protein LOC111081881 isoform X1 [Drosophila obscura]XP_041450142.1 uncharacterized protein LOC111081881 isoform X1 [Drosophila obscura]
MDREIQEISNVGDWKYVPSKLNPADEATKITKIDFTNNNLWLTGPQFLHNNSDHWPVGKISVGSQDIDPIDKEYVNVTSLLRNDIDLPDVLRFSNWLRFLRTTAWTLRYVDHLKLKRQNCKELTAKEIDRAEILIFKKMQLDSYQREVEKLTKGESVDNSSSLKSLLLKMSDDGLIRLKGRLDNLNDSDYDFNSKNPIVLSKDHPITNLLVYHYHQKNCHIGVETVLSNLRHKFWITKCRNTLKKIIRNCQYFKNKRGQPHKAIIGQLPKCRIEPTERAFLKVGVDYFGPIEITVNRSHVKRYGVIFTCMASRAVHLEVAEDLSCNAFMHLFRQFGCRRGFPIEMYSDNGTNFKRASKEIQEVITDWPKDELLQFLTTKNCSWFFNPPLSPHMGGAWERLIQSVKTYLCFLLKERFPKEYTLKTLFCEIEHMINSRPLLYVPSDSMDSVPLTPNDILIGPDFRDSFYSTATDGDLKVLNMWKASQRLADMFWLKWRKEYRQYLLYSRKWTKEQSMLKEGDVVLITDSDLPRNIWPKGIIVKTYQATDGCVRIVDVKIKDKIYKRPIVKLIKLDVKTNV